MKNLSLHVFLILVTSNALCQNYEVIEDPEMHSLIGKQAPDIQTRTLDGKYFDLKSLRGKVILLNFWGLNCAVCYKEIIELNTIAAEYTSKDVVVISAMEDSTSSILNKIKRTDKYYELNKPILKNSAIDFELLPDCKALFTLYEIEGVPMNFVIDKNGVVRGFSSGYRNGISAAGVNSAEQSDNYKLLTSKLDQVLAQKE